MRYTNFAMEDKVKSKMSRASSLPSASKNNSSNTSTNTNRVNALTQAEVVKSRILKTEAQFQIHRNLENNVGIKIEDDELENPDSPYIDVEALSDGDEKVEGEQGNYYIKDLLFGTKASVLLSM